MRPVRPSRRYEKQRSHRRVGAQIRRADGSRTPRAASRRRASLSKSHCQRPRALRTNARRSRAIVREECRAHLLADLEVLRADGRARARPAMPRAARLHRADRRLEHARAPARASRRGPRPPPHRRRWRTAPAGSRRPGSRARARMRARRRHRPRPASLSASASATRVPCTCASHSGSRGRESAARNASAILRHRGRIIAHVLAQVEARRRAPRSRPRCAACRRRAPLSGASHAAAAAARCSRATRRSASARSAAAAPGNRPGAAPRRCGAGR